ncbi:hypothetical protein [Verrucomicrobium spinosum]|uniref:hypothetical protein n=1 Tax=Verrucomicrobium spinosum TaxID=2736 RepID=UPI00017456A7|nr:hypothetical protein [Verrucomicrobium spinosum]
MKRFKDTIHIFGADSLGGVFPEVVIAGSKAADHHNVVAACLRNGAGHFCKNTGGGDLTHDDD